MSKELNYSQIATDIVQLVGGQENIHTLGYCMTRLRFVFIDEGRAMPMQYAKLMESWVLYRQVANLLSLWKKIFCRPHGSNQKYNINKGDFLFLYPWEALWAVIWLRYPFHG